MIVKTVDDKLIEINFNTFTNKSFFYESLLKNKFNYIISKEKQESKIKKLIN